MLRYLRLYAYFLRFSISKALEFRVDYYFRVVMDLIYYVINIAFYRVLYQHTSLLAGWSETEVMVFVATYLVVDALNMSFFANNLWWFPIYVNRGDLDYYLVRPVSTLFFLSLREFAANSALNLVMATSILVWAVSGLPTRPGLGELLLFGVLLLNGCFLYYLTHMITLIPVFWTHSARGFGNVFFLMARFMERPDRIFTGLVRKALITVMPFALMASFPSQVLLDDGGWRIALHVTTVSVLLFLGLLGFWRVALRAYSSASS